MSTPEAKLSTSGCIVLTTRFISALLVSPLLVPERSFVQLVATSSPVGQELVHQSHELLTVPTLQQVHQFVDDDVLQASRVLLRQLGVEPDRP